MNQLNLRNNRLKFSTLEIIPIILGEFKENPRDVNMCYDWLNLETLGSQLIMPKKSPWTLVWDP